MHTLNDYLTFILPILIAAIGTKWSDWLFAINTWLDARGPLVKRLIVGTFTFILALVASKLMVALSGDPMTDIGALASALLAFVFHVGKQASEIKAKVGAESTL